MRDEKKPDLPPITTVDAALDLLLRLLDSEHGAMGAYVNGCPACERLKQVEALRTKVRNGQYVGEFHTPTLLKAAEIARESYPQNSEYDVLMKIAAGSIAGTLERMAHSPISPESKT